MKVNESVFSVFGCPKCAFSCDTGTLQACICWLLILLTSPDKSVVFLCLPKLFCQTKLEIAQDGWSLKVWVAVTSDKPCTQLVCDKRINMVRLKRKMIDILLILWPHRRRQWHLTKWHRELCAPLHHCVSGAKEKRCSFCHFYKLPVLICTKKQHAASTKVLYAILKVTDTQVTLKVMPLLYFHKNYIYNNIIQSNRSFQCITEYCRK